MATYTQIQKGNWKAEESFGYINNKQKKIRKQGFATKKEAQEWVREQTEKIRKGYVNTSNKIIFKDYLEDWFTNYKVPGLSYNTKNNYISRINTHILPALGDYKLIEINNSIIQDFYNSLIKQGLKPSSVKKTMEILSGVFRYAKKNKVITVIPLDISKQKLNKPSLEVWTKKELDYFLQKVEGTYLYLPVFLAALIGARPGELCALQWKDIDFRKGTISISKQVIIDRTNSTLSVTDILKTTTSKRIITIPQILINFLQKEKEERESTEKDFIIKEYTNTNALMCNYNNLNANFTRKIKEINKELKAENKEEISYISFNGLRHTHATMLVQAGENIKVISKRMGHKDINTTLKYYTHVTEDMENNTAILLNNLFKNNE